MLFYYYLFIIFLFQSYLNVYIPSCNIHCKLMISCNLLILFYIVHDNCCQVFMLSISLLNRKRLFERIQDNLWILDLVSFDY